ncbi:MAG: hypothetical protein ACKVX9_13760 [Blastocatellia bacterium]
MFNLNNLFDALSLVMHLVLDPFNKRHHVRVLISQALRQLHDERPASLFACSQALNNLGNRVFLLLVCRGQQNIGKGVRFFAVLARRNDALRQTPEILDQSEPQGDRHRPQFANRQRCGLLICANKTLERVAIKAAVAMGDKGEGDGVDARVSAHFAHGEFGQLIIETLRQVLPDLAKLFLDDMEIINQPFGGGGDGLSRESRLNKHLVRGRKPAPIFFKTREQQTAALRPVAYLMFRRQRDCILFQSLDTE